MQNAYRLIVAFEGIPEVEKFKPGLIACGYK
jgi:hypothetical protein